MSTPLPRGDVRRREGRRPSLHWISWLLGVAMLAAVVVVALHFSEERQLLAIVERAEPWWLGAAVLLQAATYLAQGEIWRLVPRAARVALPVWEAFKLSLAKLFIDQALPSGGISGTVVVAKALEQRGIALPIVMASVVVDNVSFYGAYVLALLLALLIAALAGHASVGIVLTALAFAGVSAALTAAALSLSGHGDAAPRWLKHIPLVRSGLELLGEAEPTLARSPRLILVSGVLQLAILLLDAATVWVLILSLGELASPTGVFASFMISTLLRTVGFAPGGLGVFEAASVVTLKLAGVPVPVALGATLMFRGLSFWLPMVPGLFFSREARGA
ncbi:MAG TPA: lysylphosphatidylglycerol synthase transmembrane domain-containing protein [Gammaproteobacteria bacterium]|nr:lysylphosphatidylglycerol synthase transmembrane domain-containing protein [Gammaproteobacteria bacterium]